MKDVVSTSRSPKAIGPYSQAIKANGLAFVSGQLPIDPASGRLVAGDAAVQAEVILGNLKAILEAAGSSPAKTVKATLYLKDMNDFAKVNEVYGRFFPSAPPARSTVEVTRLRNGASLELDLIALA